MIDSLRPYISRIISPLIVAFILWLAHFGVTLPADAAGKITEVGVIILVAVAQALFGLIHKAIDAKVNPSDAANTNLAAQGKLLAKRSISRADLDAASKRF